MTHLEIIKEAYDKCDIIYQVFTNEDKPEWQYLILVGDHPEEYKGLTSKQALRICRSFMEFRNGKIASY